MTKITSKTYSAFQKMPKIAIVILLIFNLGKLHAQIVTDRPDQTESSLVVGGGNLQIESGILVSYISEELISINQFFTPTNLFRYGITKRFELRLLSQFETRKINDTTYQGISDLEIGTKIQILDSENSKTKIAFITHLYMPTGSKELTLDRYGTINKLSISHELTEAIGLGYNLGYNYFGLDNGSLTYSLALGIAVSEKVGVYAEPYGELLNLEEFVLNVDAGFTYLFNPNVQFDFSFGTSVTHSMNYISIGCSWLLEKSK